LVCEIWDSSVPTITAATAMQLKLWLGALLQLAALALRQASPDAKTLVVLESVLKALSLDLATRADALGIASGTALFREERLRVGLSAKCIALPSQWIVLRIGISPRDAEKHWINEPVFGYSITSFHLFSAFRATIGLHGCNYTVVIPVKSS